MSNKQLQATRLYDANEVDDIVEPVIRMLQAAYRTKDKASKEKLIIEARKRLVDMLGYRRGTFL